MRTVWILLLFGSLITYHFLPPASGEGVPSTDPKPSFDQCKPYVDAALKTGSSPQEEESSSNSKASVGDSPPDQNSDEDDDKTGEQDSGEGDDSKEDADGNSKDGSDEDGDTKEEGADDDSKQVKVESDESEEDGKPSNEGGDGVDSKESDEDSKEGDKGTGEDDSADSKEKADASDENDSNDTTEGDAQSQESDDEFKEGGDGQESKEGGDGQESKEGDESEESKEGGDDDSKPETSSAEDDTPTDGNSSQDSGEEAESDGTLSDNVADQADESESAESKEEEEAQEDQHSSENASTTESEADVSGEDAKSDESKEGDSDGKSEEGKDESDDDGKSSEEEGHDEKSGEEAADDDSKSEEAGDVKQDDKSEEDGKTEESKSEEDNDSKSGEDGGEKSGEDGGEKSGEDSDGKSDEGEGDEEKSGEDDDDSKSGESSDGDESDEDSDEVEPYIPRSRDHLTELLGLDDSDRTKTTFSLLNQATQITLKELKRIYENAIKPLENIYKLRDLSNRHFGDPEIFSKPLVVFMGPWSGGKSTIINWLLDIKDEDAALRTGADPSPAQFNIMIHGKEEEVLDGTQLAADWTFSGLQKFGQSFLDRLRGRKLPNRLLEKVNIVEIPGILEVRKQVERSFPFNDACQWFIDRADVLFLVYDPSKLDIGPETEAILDQLKGRESQVRIILNKADTVTPDELLRVQAMLVWNISPLMSSAEPPVMYAASLWDRPLLPDSPKSLLMAHENHFLKDIRDGIEKQVETRIAAARRFAVRIRNHAKMVDCYLNTYHNHRSFFSDKKKVSNDIIDHPQNYHIYEGLSTLTNISRYDLPDPDTYKDFFKLNHLWDFPTLASTCSYFKGCPINKLDIAIAYELPELLGKFRRQREAILTAQAQKASATPK